jgi:uncharacterized protein (DUF779 family)
MAGTQESSYNVVLTDDAREVLGRVRGKRGDRLSLVIGNGCCDSTAPYLFADYLPGPNEQLIGQVEDVPVYLDETLVRTFGGSEIVVDARSDPQPDSFSCESELGYRFVLDRLPAAS